ncbi:hypothetical protein CVT25_000369 [Psilocybe cyanescens]|uniref:Uncharacterized protein n=1 Tax=Psilocybe cyanescens TaxID=93625 RepID=A0A409W8L0_PSICY|nr:hypothetical protein CVT25_000369 [Psilocybe cyanescens]
MSDYVTHDCSVATSPPMNRFVDSASSVTFRTLDFMTNNLGDEIDLVLLFEPPKVGKLYVDVFPICWKILSFSATGIGSATVEYTGDSGFVVPQKESSANGILASNSQYCKIGEKCTLKTNANGNINYLTPAVDSSNPNVMQCLNLTERPARIGARNILGLRSHTDWNVSIDPGSGQVQIVEGSPL